MAEERAGGPRQREILLALAPEERQAALLDWLRGEAGRALRVAPGSLAPDRPLTGVGLDSLAAIELAGRVEADLGVELPLGDLLDGASLAAIAGIAGATLAAAAPPVGDADGAAPGSVPEWPGESALSHGQRGLWFVERLAPGEAVHQIVAAARVGAGLDEAALGRALAALAARHPALRTTFAEAGGEPVQRVHARLAPEWFVEDARGWSEARLEARLAAAAYRPFDLARGPLVRLGCFLRPGGERVLLFAIHHLIADFWSLAVLARELGDLYRMASGMASGAVAALPPPARDYRDHVVAEARRLAGPRGERLWAYWLERLGGELPTLDLALDRSRPAVRTYRGAARAARLAPDLGAGLAALARARGLTLYAVLLAGFQALLHRLTGQDDLVVGSPAAGRLGAEWAGTVGYFVNPVALRADLRGDPPAAELLVRTREAVLGALDHQELPLPLLVERLQPVRDPGRPPLFQAMFVLQRAQRAAERPLAAFALGAVGAAIDLGGLRVESRRFPPRRAELDLTLRMAELDGSGGLAASLLYDSDLLDGATAERLLGHLATLLGALAADPGRRLSELPLLTAAERQQLAVEWNAAPPPPEPSGGRRPIHALFEAQVARTPEAVALAAGEESLTYRELDRRAGLLAGRLRQLGVGPEVRVAICAERSPAMVVGLLAILKAGGAYVPLDPAYPQERLAALLADSAAAVLLTQAGPAARLPAHGVPAIDLDRLARAAAEGDEPLSAASVPLDPDNLAYVIYTSGSTGRPKGVAITHGSAWTLLAWAREAFPPADLACVLAATSICFDVSVFELFAPLAWGGRLLLAADALELAELPGRGGVTLLCTVPSAAAELARLGAVPASVRTVNLGGEAVPRALVEALHAPGTVGRVLNLYGPSEDTTYSTVAELAAGEAGAPGIGRPVAGTTAHVLGPGREPLPIGAAGELYLGGAGLARGYLDRPELTAERFVPDPWSGRPGGRSYRTGDLARRRPSGELEFLGRIDQQIKVRGFRVEPGEIEAALAAHPAVAEAAVVLRQAAGGDGRLAAFVVPATGAAADAAAWREHLRARLPEYMVPAAIVALAAMPRTPNGKLDRRALAAAAPAGRPADAAAPSRTPIEELLAGIWAALLGVERVAPGDDFFALGGHSLLAARVVSRVREVLGVELPVRSLFETPTLAALAARVERTRGVSPPAEPIPRTPRAPGAAGETTARLSFAQERLWFLDRLEPGGAAYNMPAAVRLRGQLAPGPFAAALAGLAGRHETLRTTFREVAGEPLQAITPEPALPLPLVDLAGLPAAARGAAAAELAGAEARRPFDLARGPLLRALLLCTAKPPEAPEHVALFTLHHIVSDGWSMGIFLRDLAALYGAALEGRPSPLPELPVQYADYAAWQRRRLESGIAERQLDYWRGRLAGSPASLDLPLDRPRRTVESRRGAAREVVLPAALAGELAALSRHFGCTLFMTLLAAFQALLAGAAGEEDVLVGSPVANRGRPELEELVGLFVNTLVFRGDLAADPSFGELLGRVREGALAAYDHQDLPFERLVEELRPERDLSRPPLVQVLFVLQNAPPPVPALPGLALSPLPSASGTAKLDLTLALAERAGGLSGEIEYAADLFDATTVARLGERYARLLAAAAAAPDRRLSALPLLAAGERQQLVVEWNDTEIVPPADLPVQRLVERQAERRPDRTALVEGGDTLTYGELDRRAAALAHRLRGLGVGPERIVGLCAERSLARVVAMLAILKAGGAYLPLDPAHPAPRLQAMLAETGAAVLLSQARLARRLPPSRCRLVLLDDEPGAASDAHCGPAEPDVEVSLDGLAYVTYTSGSTGRPKGVGVTHRGVARLVAGDYARFGPGEVFLQLSPIAFDTSTFEVWGALVHGATLAIMPPGIPTPAALAGELARHGVTTLWLTAPLFHQMVEERLDGLAGVRQLLTGGDVVSPPHARRLVEALPSCRLIDGYGPTENTTFTCCFALGAEPVTGSVPVGRPIGGTRAHILDARGAPVPIGVAGELCAGGDGLARGYVGQPAMTAERFVPDPLGAAPGGRLYRTGDLARLLLDGNVEFLGRRDHQIKLRGFRIEPGEIEAALAEHPAVATAAVLLRREESGEARLVAYLALAEGAGAAPAPAELREHLARQLPEPMLPAAYVVLPALPLSPNGKVDRRALAGIAPPLASRAAAAGRAPSTPAEQLLAGIWRELLAAEEIAAEDDFFALGGHSLLATRLLSRVRDAFGVELPVRALFEHSRLAALAVEIERAMEPAAAGPPPIAPLPRPAAGPLAFPASFAQERLWFLDQLLPGSPVYAVPLALDLRGPLDAAALAAALTAVVRRHEALRTTFADSAAGPLQAVAPPAPFPLPLVDLAALAEPRRRAEAERLTGEAARRPFDLARGPLVRGTLLRTAAAEHSAVVGLHHAVCDGWSMGVLLAELAALYAAAAAERPSPLAALPIQYADFAAWQRAWLAGGVLDPQLRYWRERLAGAPALDLPADRPRPAVQSFRGAEVERRLSPELSLALDAAARRHGATPFMVLLAALQALLGRLSGQRDVTVGSPVANRRRPETEGLIGLFVNTLALRGDLSGDPPAAELLARARQVCLGAYAHQDLPFERLVEAVAPERDLSRPALFSVFLVDHNVPLDELRLGELAACPRGLSTGTAKFDLSLLVGRAGRRLRLAAEHSTDLFDRTTVERLLGQFETLLAGLVAAPVARLSELPLLTAAERQQVEIEWNATGEDFRERRPIHELFAAQAARTPDAIALAAPEGMLTYGGLDRRAGRLAARLRELRVGPEARVGVCAERSPALLVGLLAVLKAGAAYVPLDPDYPRERLAFLFADAGVAILLAQGRLAARLPDGLLRDLRVVDLDRLDSLDLDGVEPLASVPLDPENLAYVIYTSGSTGHPKGVMNRHGGIANRLLWMQAAFRLGAADRVLQKTPFSFDVSVWELFWPFLAGARLVLARPGGHQDPDYLAGLIAAEGVTTVHFVPSMLQVFLDSPEAPRCTSLRRVIASGEALTGDLARRYYSRLAAPLYNLYGPTEAAVDATWWACDAAGGGPAAPTVPIGRPISNLRVHLLDRGLAPVPVGVTGEVYLGGAGLARGYLGRPDLTAERFVPDPRGEAPGERSADRDGALGARQADWNGALGARLYRTGDLGRLRADGGVEYLGRTDFQVKVRGFRIELGEIEAALAAHPAVAQAVVTARGSGADLALVAYLAVPRNGGSPSPPSVSALREHLAARLPEYMLPAHFLVLPALPLSPNGKVDRAALPAPSGERPDLEVPYVEPGGELERAVAAVWRAVLGLERVGRDDNFFALGGTSLALAQVRGRLRRETGRDLPLVDLFRFPTVGALAAQLAALEGEETGAPRGPAFEQVDERARRSRQALERRRRSARGGAGR